MSISTQIVAELMAAGLQGEALLAALGRIEEALHTVTGDVTVTPGALRTRRYRERHKASQSVTGDVTSVTVTNPTIDSKKEGLEEERKIVVRKRHDRHSYPPLFEEFWKAFPTDPGMSKSEALKQWTKLSDGDQDLAIKAIPSFKTWASKQGETYRVVHACRYLSQRRFEGFAVEAEKINELKAAQVYVEYGTDAGDAWELFYRQQGKIPPRNGKNGWYFPTEFPEPMRRTGR